MNKWLMIALFASLPFFSIRAATGGVSVTLVLMGVITLVVLVQQFTVRHKLQFQPIDYAHMAYLAIAAASLLFFRHESATGSLIQASVYFAAFLAIRHLSLIHI